MSDFHSRNHKLRVAINGFGRLGRNFFKLAVERSTEFEIVAINDPADNARLLQLLKHDSSKGDWNYDPKLNNETLKIDGSDILMFSKNDVTKLPWDFLNVGLVLEASGEVKNRGQAMNHISAGSSHVVISTQIDKPDITLIHGLNLDSLDASEQTIITNSTCTAHALAPLVDVVDSNFGLMGGFCAVNHSLTRSQSTHDDLSNPSKRKARAGWESIIPASTPAADILNSIKEYGSARIQSTALRVPVNNVSALILSVKLDTSTTPEEVIQTFRKASAGSWQGLLATESDPLVSTDFTKSPFSCTLDEQSVKLVNEDHLQLLGWYDNEWGYSNRLIELLNLLQTQLRD